MTKEYYALILPETKEIVWDNNKKIVCHRCIVKQHIQSGTQLEYVSPTAQGNIVVQQFYNKNGKAISEVKATGDEVYVQTDIPCQWWEVLYGPVLNY